MKTFKQDISPELFAILMMIIYIVTAPLVMWLVPSFFLVYIASPICAYMGYILYIFCT